MLFVGEELRLYSFCNFYYSSIQQGIQTGHMSDNMTVKYMGYPDNYAPKNVWQEWITNHKTYIVLNSGDYDSIIENGNKLLAVAHQLNLPYADFIEPGVGNVRTTYGVVVPERYFNAVREMVPIDSGGSIEVGFKYTNKEGEITRYQVGSLQYDFIQLLKSCPLAK